MPALGLDPCQTATWSCKDVPPCTSLRFLAVIFSEIFRPPFENSYFSFLKVPDQVGKLPDQVGNMNFAKENQYILLPTLEDTLRDNSANSQK